MNRRQFVSRMSLSAAATMAFSKIGHTATGYFSYLSIAEDYVDVEITHGKIRGVRNEGVNIFKGIPYAGRISGDRRFRRPAPLEPWTGVREALQFVGHQSVRTPIR